MSFPVFVSTPKGLEYLLEDELKSLGFPVSRVSPQGVFGDIELDMIYRVCLWSRLASRVHLILFEGPASHKDELYGVCRAFAWDGVFSAEKTIAVTFHGESSAFRNTLFGAQVIKDAMVDFFREKNNTRPSVERNSPQVLIHGYLKQDNITVSLDLTGYSLHQRGYRLDTGIAPLKEHIAAALLTRAHWQELSTQGFALHDPCCGAGTLVIEAAMMAAHIAPGLLREDQSFQWWKAHEPARWDAQRQDAKKAIQAPDVRLLGSDSDESLLESAKANARRAGVADWIEWDAIPQALAKPIQPRGLLITNPPYGVRLGDETALVPFYRELGHVLHSQYQGWQAAVLTSSVMLAKSIGLRSHKQYTIYNGALLCKLYCITLDASSQLFEASRPSIERSAGAMMFANRLQKNAQHLQKWAKRNHISCYRLYDADLPEYSFAIDLYQNYVVLQEYAAPSSIDPLLAEKRRQEVIQVIPEVLNIPKGQLIVKERRQQKGLNQYEKLNQKKQSLVVTEGSTRFEVNLTDYLDTGLFLDHRPLRLQFASLKSGMRFLNCFCYTATASVHAALSGALTVNVDLSNTYLTWALENFKLNKIDASKHQFIQYDCLMWLKTTQDRFDVIFLDPPSFSNSKRMQTTLDIQRDHEFLIEDALKLLNPGGVLYFSTNFRQFKLSPTLLANQQVRDITPSTIDLDFKRNHRIHHCFKITNTSF